MQRLLLFIPVILLFCSCAAFPTAQIGLYYGQQAEDLGALLAEIEKRNSTIERHPAWISQATRDFMIRNLEDISETEYSKYQQYLDDGAMYIIVHPAYYVFFHDREPIFADENAVDTFLNERVYTTHMRFLQEQERSMRDFLEITSTRKRLVVLVLPGNYRDYSGFIYRELPDEFARYVNSVTNASESVLYVFSEKPNKGSLPDKANRILHRFLEEVKPNTILVGGGYLGRCVDDFYKHLAGSVAGREVMIAGEISAFSPEDVKSLDLADYVKDGKLDLAVIQETVAAKKNRGENSLKGILRNYRNYRNGKS
ncbi:MAG: phage tail assembly protein [Nitrospirae bacterium]|nr:phage tail assembly protein [Nitrospirota bacterium]MCL5421608.1 phage tail assembly protein [Nitrospirota bacterium]